MICEANDSVSMMGTPFYPSVHYIAFTWHADRVKIVVQNLSLQAIGDVAMLQDDNAPPHRAVVVIDFKQEQYI